jgi:hypothetical protein
MRVQRCFEQAITFDVTAAATLLGELRSIQQRAQARPVKTDCSHYFLIRATERVAGHPPDITPWWCRLHLRQAQSATIHSPCTIPNQILPYLYLQRVGLCQGTITCYYYRFELHHVLIVDSCMQENSRLTNRNVSLHVVPSCFTA